MSVMNGIDRSFSEILNQNCYCVGTDTRAMAEHLATLNQRHGLPPSAQPLFSDLPVFITAEEMKTMQAIVSTVYRTIALPAWRDRVFGDATPVERFRSSAPVFMGFDFHLSADGPKLIEINTNAGGGLLCAEGTRFESTTWGSRPACLSSATSNAVAGQVFIDHFLIQFKTKFGRLPVGIAIVDDSPLTQPLHPEFLLVRDLFAGRGLAAVIVDAADLLWDGSRLKAGELNIDLVYNRLTDFRLEEPRHQALTAALLSGQILLTPDPFAHTLLANKRNLVLLSDQGFLKDIGVSAADQEVLLSGIPETRMVKPEEAPIWWARKDHWFFKPVSGYASKGTWRGSKMTRKVFETVIGGGYVAQAFVPPALRATRPRGATTGDALKFDIRCYVFEGQIDLVAARLYQGQTTNLRTPGGGFAPVFIAADIVDCPQPA
jgi:hypothetical protein